MKFIVYFLCDSFISLVAEADVVDLKDYSEFVADDWRNLSGQARISVKYQDSVYDACVLQVS